MTTKILDGRGVNMSNKGKQTRQKVKDYIMENPDCLKKDCCEALGISYQTLKKHLNALGGKK